MNGVINLYKPSGMSSATAVGKVKRILNAPTVGHMGTLDPMAEGVLVIGVGKSARLFDHVCSKRKSYIAKFKFGYETDTLDALGTAVSQTSDIPSVDAVIHAMQSLIGKSEQIPPIYSAKHINGKRAYALARSGKPEEPKPVEIEIFGAELICQPSMNEFVFSVDCSAGTYIRSICRDVAKMCGSLATLTYLQRTRSGKFKVEDSVKFDELEIKRESALIPPQDVLDLPRVDFPDAAYDDIDHGRSVKCNRAGDFLTYCRNVFFGIGCACDGKLKIKTYLKDA